MTSFSSTAAALSFVCLTTALAAQSFTYADFSNVGSLAMLGNAAQSGTALRLTANVPGQRGVAWHRTALPVTAGFDTTFAFRITPPSIPGLGEGLALVIQDDPNGIAAIGGTNASLGYGSDVTVPSGIRNSIAIELDTRLSGLDDWPGVSIQTRGTQGNEASGQYSIGGWWATTPFADGLLHTLRVRYAPGTIEVYLDGAATPLASAAYDLLDGGLYANGQPAPGLSLPGGTAYVGFCATTNVSTYVLGTQLTEILSWDWASAPLRAPCYAGSIGEDLLTVDGSAGNAFRTVRLATYQPFTIGLDSATAAGSGMPYVLMLSLFPQPGAPGTALGFGDTCMPVLPFGPAELVFADSFGIFPALLPSGPAPFQFPLPAGVVTFPLDFTLQAVTIASLSPFEFGVTNAIDVKIAPAAAPAITQVLPATAAPGQAVTISGAGFVPGFTLAVGGSTVVPTSSTESRIVFPFPAGLACDSALTVANPDGQSATFAINPSPTITSVTNGSGPAAGNQAFLVHGVGFAPGTTATVGGAPATMLGATATVLTMLTPPGTPGPAAIVVTTPGGCTASATYTYQ